MHIFLDKGSVQSFNVDNFSKFIRNVEICGFGKIGLVICFDRHYPESIRTEVLRGAYLVKMSS